MSKKKEQKTTEELLEEISSKLKCLTYLLGLRQFGEGKNEEHTEKLNKLGFSNEEIALMIGSTAESVRVTLYNLKKKKKTKGKSDASKKEGHQSSTT